MQIEMLKPKIVEGKHYKLGDTLDVSKETARLLIVTQAAREYVPPPPKPKRSRSKKDV